MQFPSTESFFVAFLLQILFLGTSRSDKSITQPPSGSYVASWEGESASIFCEVFSAETAVPQVTIWRVQYASQTSPVNIYDSSEGFEIDGEVFNDLEHTYGNDVELRTNLTVLAATEELDGAVITCGYIDVTAFSVIGEFVFKLYRPPCLRDLGVVTAIENTAGVQDLSCLNSKEPFPPPDNTLLRLNGEVFSSAQYNHSHVVLDAVKRSNAGVFTLTVSNHGLDDADVEIGFAEGSFYLDVLYGPEIQEGPSTVIALKSDKVVLQCGTALEGNPPSTVTWRDNRDFVVVGEDGGLQVREEEGEVSLRIQEASADHTGDWKCYLSNSVSQRVVNILLVVFELPSEPFDLLACDCNVTDNTTQVGLSWKRPSNAGRPKLTGYKVDIFLYNHGMMHFGTQMVSGESTEVVVWGLDPAQNYSFQISAVSEYVDEVTGEKVAEMQGRESMIVMASTSPGEIIVSCQQTKAGKGVVDISWTVLSDGGLKLTNVYVEYAMYGSNNEFRSTANAVMDPYREWFEAQGHFVTGETYSFRIAAQNSHTSSEPVSCDPVSIIEGVPVTPDPPLVIYNNSSGKVMLLLRTTATGVSHSPQSTFVFLVMADSSKPEDSILLTYPFQDYSGGKTVEVEVTLLASGLYLFSAAGENEYGASEFSGNSDPIHITVKGVQNSTVVSSSAAASPTYVLALLFSLAYLSS